MVSNILLLFKIPQCGTIDTLWFWFTVTTPAAQAEWLVGKHYVTQGHFCPHLLVFSVAFANKLQTLIYKAGILYSVWVCIKNYVMCEKNQGHLAFLVSVTQGHFNYPMTQSVGKSHKYYKRNKFQTELSKYDLLTAYALRCKLSRTK